MGTAWQTVKQYTHHRTPEIKLLKRRSHKKVRAKWRSIEALKDYDELIIPRRENDSYKLG